MKNILTSALAGVLAWSMVSVSVPAQGVFENTRSGDDTSSSLMASPKLYPTWPVPAWEAPPLPPPSAQTPWMDVTVDIAALENWNSGDSLQAGFISSGNVIVGNSGGIFSSVPAEGSTGQLSGLLAGLPTSTPNGFILGSGVPATASVQSVPEPGPTALMLLAFLVLGAYHYLLQGKNLKKKARA